LRWFANQCSDVAWSCIEQWRGDNVRDWYWCVWNKTNCEWIGGGLSFEQYRRIYEEVAAGVLHWLTPHLAGRKALIGGPSVDGFQPFWLDWLWLFVNEIDNSLIGFVDWHCYGDWREHGERGAPLDPATHHALLVAQTTEYEIRARAIARILGERDILNICGELNAHSHVGTDVRVRFNHSIVGATFYASALLYLMRAGVDAEMFWIGTEQSGGYGLMGRHGEPKPAFHAKRLIARHVRYGDRISFPVQDQRAAEVNVIVSRGDDGRRSAVLVHLQDVPAVYRISELAPGLEDCHALLKLDRGTAHQVEQARFDGIVAFEGFGVAVVTNAASTAEPSGI
jgi:hypothetical protein